MFHHILFPIDFSERCKEAVPFVKAFADRYRAKVTLMHVVQIPTGWYGGMEAAYPVMFDVPEMEKEARQELIKFYLGPTDSEPVADLVEVVAHGDPSAEIVQYAEHAGVDLIMMPTHGYGKFRRLLLGSVTAQVLHDALCPVWTAAHAEEEWASHPECRHILCAVDVTERSLPVIRDAAKLGAELAASVLLVHAVRSFDDDMTALPGEGGDFFIKSARRLIQELQRTAATNLQLCVHGGDVSEVVRKTALHHNADLLVIGRGRMHERFGRLRTNTYAIIRDSPCPVLSV